MQKKTTTTTTTKHNITSRAAAFNLLLVYFQTKFRNSTILLLYRLLVSSLLHSRTEKISSFYIMSESIYSLNLKKQLKNNNSCDATLLTKPIFDFHRVIKYCYGSDLRSLMITKKTHRLDPSPLWFYIMIWLTLKLRRAVTKYQELQPIDRGKSPIKSDNNLLLLFFFYKKRLKDIVLILD